MPSPLLSGCNAFLPQGYFNYTVLYYGAYSPDSLAGLLRYNIRLAYFFTISAYMVLCGAAIIYKSVHPR